MEQGFKSWCSEFLGTFTLCFIGEGAICIHQMTAPAESGLLAVAIAHGLALAVMISALGAVSGAHFNPAVTFGFLVTRRMSLPSAVAYWVAQLAGALAASALLVTIVPDAVWQAVHLGAAGLQANLTPLGGIIVEFVLTFFLVTAVWGTAVDERRPSIGGFGIGLAVTMDILVGGPLTGAAMNPARALGPALVAGFWQDHWVFWVGPMLGGAAAALFYDRVVMPRKA
jgi:MIP family channel proteins